MEPILSSYARSRFQRSATLIIPRLYLSDLHTASHEGNLSQLGVTHVVSAIEFVPNIPKSIPDEQRLQISIADRGDVNILQYFEETTEFIKKALSESTESKVLVHCVQGVSRSATIVCAYIIATSDNKMTAHEVVSFVQSKRSIVCPNLGFRMQLEEYATRFFGTKSNKSSLRSTSLGSIVAERIRQLKTTNHCRVAQDEEDKDVVIDETRAG